jgi:hypothetical protein
MLLAAGVATEFPCFLMLRCDGAGAEAEAATSDTGMPVPPFSLPFWVLTEDPDPAKRCTAFSFTCFTKFVYLSFIVLLELRMFHVYRRMKHGKFGCDLEQGYLCGTMEALY